MSLTKLDIAQIVVNEGGDLYDVLKFQEVDVKNIDDSALEAAWRRMEDAYELFCEEAAKVYNLLPGLEVVS